MTHHHPSTSLEAFKIQARNLLQQARAGDDTAMARIKSYFRLHPDTPPKLHQAQLTIAREQGFESWPKLRNL